MRHPLYFARSGSCLRSGRTAVLAAAALSPALAGGGGDAFLQEAVLASPAAAAGDREGSALALEGDTLLVGAPGDAHAGASSGALHVFRSGPSGWTHAQELVAFDAAAGDRFGSAVARDGSWLAVGAPQDDGRGAVYPFELVLGSWTSRGKLVAPDAAAGDAFGLSLALEGDTLVVGAPNDDDACPPSPDCDSGSAYVFTRGGTTWSFDAKLVASDATADAWFGYAVALEGGTAVAGAPDDVLTEPGSPAGAAYVFTRGQTAWSETQKLQAPAPAQDDEFGYALALDGDTLAVGAPATSDSGTSSNPGTGRVHVFRRNGLTWTAQAALEARAYFLLDSLGRALDLDGDVLVTSGADGTNDQAGCAYVFRDAGSSWSREQRLTAYEGGDADVFGVALAVSGDVLAAGAPLRFVPPEAAGAAVVFRAEPSPWSSFCDRSDGSLAACPCGAGGDDTGCDSALSPGGTRAVVTSLTDDRAGIALEGFGGSGPIVVMRSGARAGPVTFGNGALCLSIPLVRMRTLPLGPTTSAFVRVGHGVGPGTFHYQIYHRDCGGCTTHCSSTGFSSSSGVSIAWP